MKLEDADEYKEHGCNIVGDLVVVRYTDEWQKDPNHNKFGSMCVFDYKDKALELVKKTYPDAIVALAIPDLVCRKNT